MSENNILKKTLQRPAELIGSVLKIGGSKNKDDQNEFDSEQKVKKESLFY